MFGDSEYEALMRLLVLFVPEVELYLLTRGFTRAEKKWFGGMTMQEIREAMTTQRLCMSGPDFHSHWQTACWIIGKRMERSAKKSLS